MKHFMSAVFTYFALLPIFILTYYKTGTQILWKIQFMLFFTIIWLLAFFCISSESYAVHSLLFRIFLMTIKNP